jgi:hypothetical protein
VSRRDTGIIKYCLDEADWDPWLALQVWKREVIDASRKKRKVKALDLADELGVDPRTLRSWAELGRVWGMTENGYHKGKLKFLLWVDRKEVTAYAKLSIGEKRALTIARRKVE